MDKLKYSKFNYKIEDKAGNIVLYRRELNEGTEKASKKVSCATC